MVWFGKAQLNASFGPRLVCGDTKLLRAFSARRPSGSAEPRKWPHFPICVGWNHSISRPTIGLESAVCPFWVTPLGPRPHGPSDFAPGRRPRPNGPPGPKRGTGPRRGHGNSRFTLGAVHVKGAPPKALLW